MAAPKLDNPQPDVNPKPAPHHDAGQAEHERYEEGGGGFSGHDILMSHRRHSDRPVALPSASDWLKAGENPSALLQDPRRLSDWAAQGIELSRRSADGHFGIDFKAHFVKQLAAAFKTTAAQLESSLQPGAIPSESWQDKPNAPGSRAKLEALLQAAAQIRQADPAWGRALIGTTAFLSAAAKTDTASGNLRLSPWLSKLDQAEGREAIHWLTAHAGANRDLRTAMLFVPGIEARQAYLDASAAHGGLDSYAFGSAVMDAGDAGFRKLAPYLAKIPDSDMALAQALAELSPATILEYKDRILSGSPVARGTAYSVLQFRDPSRDEQNKLSEEQSTQFKDFQAQLESKVAADIKQELTTGGVVRAADVGANILLQNIDQFKETGMANIRNIYPIVDHMMTDDRLQLSDGDKQKLFELRDIWSASLRQDLHKRVDAGETIWSWDAAPFLASKDPKDRSEYLDVYMRTGDKVGLSDLKRVFEGLSDQEQQQVLKDSLLTARGRTRDDLVRDLQPIAKENFPALSAMLQSAAQDIAPVSGNADVTKLPALQAVEPGNDCNLDALIKSGEIRTEKVTVDIPQLKPGVVVPPEGLSRSEYWAKVENVPTEMIAFKFKNGVEVRVTPEAAAEQQTIRDMRARAAKGDSEATEQLRRNNVPLVEDYYRLVSEMPTTDYLRVIELNNKPSVEDQFTRDDDHGIAHKLAAAAAALSAKQTVEVYPGNSLYDLRTNMKHEWSHLITTDPAWKAYQQAHILEWDAWSARDYGRFNEQEDFAVHTGERFMAVQPDLFQALISHSPARALASAAVLDSVLSGPHASASPQNDAYLARAKFAAEQAIPLYAGDLATTLKVGTPESIADHWRYLSKIATDAKHPDWVASILQRSDVMACVPQSIESASHDPRALASILTALAALPASISPELQQLQQRALDAEKQLIAQADTRHESLLQLSEAIVHTAEFNPELGRKLATTKDLLAIWGAQPDIFPARYDAQKQAKRWFALPANAQDIPEAIGTIKNKLNTDTPDRDHQMSYLELLSTMPGLDAMRADMDYRFALAKRVATGVNLPRPTGEFASVVRATGTDAFTGHAAMLDAGGQRELIDRYFALPDERASAIRSGFLKLQPDLQQMLIDRLVASRDPRLLSGFLDLLPKYNPSNQVTKDPDLIKRMEDAVAQVGPDLAEEASAQLARDGELAYDLASPLLTVPSLDSRLQYMVSQHNPSFTDLMAFERAAAGMPLDDQRALLVASLSMLQGSSHPSSENWQNELDLYASSPAIQTNPELAGIVNAARRLLDAPGGAGSAPPTESDSDRAARTDTYKAIRQRLEAAGIDKLLSSGVIATDNPDALQRFLRLVS